VIVNVFSIDVEDYFHPTEIALLYGRRSWSELPARIHVGIDLLLEYLAEYNARATFFVLGWVADRHPALVRKISDAGHEIGCHSYEHRLIYRLSRAELLDDTRRAIVAIQDACGITPRLYRAPSYSIVASNLWALEVLVECGFTHDSSIFPIAHDRYGIPGFDRHAHIIRTGSGPIIEIPIATVRLTRRRIAPVGGGAYLRLFPYRYTAGGIRRINNIEGKPACLYVHPWEMDPDQPRLASGLISRMRTYAGLRGTRAKVRELLSEFRFSAMGTVHPVSDYLGDDIEQFGIAATSGSRALSCANGV
jgi:polysaccharide deacetylase family protein (PEP-CTERM system associated)